MNTSDANLGLVVDQARLASLPLIHGDPYKIMGLAPGLAHSGSQRLDRPYEPTHIVGYAYQGTRSNRSDLLIDGAPSTATANANEVIATYVPPSDLVQEFKVQTATFDAQFGNTEGGVTSISIKSGTNRFHGSAYYFAEPYKWGRTTSSGRRAARPSSRARRTGPASPSAARSSIPELYDGKDKTFFMFGYEHIKDVRPRFDAGGDSWVPTEALRNGDFSAYSSNITIYDPLTRVPAARRQFVGQPFAGNVIPANRISPIAKKILEYYSPAEEPGPGRQHHRLDAAGNGRTTTASPAASTRRSRPTTGCSRATAGTTATASTTTTSELGGLRHDVPVPVVAVRGRRRARLQPDDRPERPVRLQPLRPQLGAAGRGAELRPDDAGLPRRSTTR